MKIIQIIKFINRVAQSGENSSHCRKYANDFYLKKKYYKNFIQFAFTFFNKICLKFSREEKFPLMSVASTKEKEENK